MLFNSIDFAIFLPIVFSLYWVIGRNNYKAQNLLIVVASYIFYGWWDWRFLSLILASTLIDYFLGPQIAKEGNERSRAFLLGVSLVVNLGLLGFFKYYNFFIENFNAAFSLFGMDFSIQSLQIILPVGISFYTFQTLSYSIDVYRGRLEPTKDFVAFAAYVSFFPQLVAGPIERATNLLPQFSAPRTFDYQKASDGVQQIIWGLFKKLVIADNCAEIANLIFNNSDQYSGSVLFLGAIFFAFQIYGDFSGYSDIAIGVARLFGFGLMQNFAFPYFSRDIAEFWRRWHISLSTWFRDYVYIPLGGSRGGTAMKVRNTFIIFLVSGFWHGANWTFIVWGALNALYFLPLLLTKRNRNNLEVVASDRLLPNLRELAQISVTFVLTVFAWIFFRAENLSHALSIVSEIFSPSTLSIPYFVGIGNYYFLFVILALFFVAEWFGRSYQYGIQFLSKLRIIPLRYFLLFCLAMVILLYGALEESEFIYFDF